MKAIKKNVGSAAKCSKKEIYFVLITSLLPKLPESANKGRLGCIYTLSVVCFLTGKDSPKNFCPIWLNGCFTIVFDIKNKKNTRRAFSRWCNARKITLWRELPFFPPYGQKIGVHANLNSCSTTRYFGKHPELRNVFGMRDEVFPGMIDKE